MYGALEGSFLASQLLCMVLLGEGYNNVLLLASLQADQLIFKARDEGAGAQLQVVAFALAALESNAVYEALEVDNNGVVLLEQRAQRSGCGTDAVPCGRAQPSRQLREP